MTPLESRELIQLWMLANEGTANDVQLAALNERIAASVEARELLISLAQHQGWMKWNAVAADASDEILAARPTCAELAAMAIDERRAGSASRSSAGHSSTSRSSMSAAGMRRGSGDSSGWLSRWQRLRFSEFAMAVSVMLACVVGYLAGRRDERKTDSMPPTAHVERDTYATMVSSTGCVWGAGEGGVLSRGGRFASGDTLQLLEGIAEFNVGPQSDVRLQMEGPTSMVLASDLGVNMSYGKVILNTMSHDGRPYPVDTVFGRILVDYGGEVGLISFGSKAEIHCFQGRAVINSPWLQQEEEGRAIESLSAGESIVLDHVGQPNLQATRGIANKLQFTPQVAMSNDFLSVNPQYVREVVKAKPIAYWRFEETAGGVAKNEIGSTFEGHLRGSVNLSGPAGNHAIELGLSETPGSMLVADSWDEVLAKDYSIELWMKPSHHHLGSMIGFVGEFDPVLRQNTHGLLLEIAGPVTRYGRSRVNRVRFLHRSPLSAVRTIDTNCISQQTYSARKWQHLVALRKDNTLQLFLNGAHVGKTEFMEPTPDGLQLVIGQLYTDSLDRFFVGQLDEIAIYDRALTAREVASHHELLRPRNKKVAPDEVL